MNRISTKRLAAAITFVNNARKFGTGRPPALGNYPFNGTPEDHANWSLAHKAMWQYELATSAKRATSLYSLRSHLRGTLHITHQYVQEKLIDGACREVCYPRTMEDQAKLVEPLMVEFAMTDEEMAAFDELRAKRLAERPTCLANEGCGG